MRRALLGLLTLALVLGPVLLPTAAASSITSQPPPPAGSGSCPTAPLFGGERAENGSLIAFFQPGESSGSDCYLANGGTLVGDTIIFGLYTPNQVAPNDVVPVAVEEFTLRSVTVSSPGPNNTTVSRQVTEQANVDWSNTTFTAAPGQVQQPTLTVPPVSSPENLTVSMLGINLSVTIVTPGAGIAIPQNYPQLLLHDFLLDVALVIFFIVGVGIATAIRLRARHVERMWPWGAAGAFAASGFAFWFQANYPLSLIPIGAAPEAVVALPTVFVGIYVWLAFWPTEAKEYKIRFPVADQSGGEGLVDQKFFRVFDGPRGPEYIGPGGNGAFLRLLGVPTLLDDKVLNPAPLRRRMKGFRSVRKDVYAEYYAWAELPGGPKVLEAHRSRVFILPWRKRTREAIAQYHRRALRGKVEEPAHVGFFLYVTPSRAFAAVVGTQGAVLVDAWIRGTLQTSKTGLALERVLVAYTELKVSLKAQAIDYGHKIALALRMAEDYPDSPIALKALEDLAIRHEAAIMDEREWLRFLEQKVQEDRTPTDPRFAVGTVERIIDSTVSPTSSPRADDEVRAWVRKRGGSS